MQEIGPAVHLRTWPGAGSPARLPLCLRGVPQMPGEELSPHPTSSRFGEITPDALPHMGDLNPGPLPKVVNVSEGTQPPWVSLRIKCTRDLQVI